MKIFSAISLFLILVVLIRFTENDNRNVFTNAKKIDSCFFDGKQLYGKIKFVEYASKADVKVKFVSSFPDLKIKFVENFADDCGEWEIVENNADLNVFIVESFEDITIKVVESFPGLD